MIVKTPEGIVRYVCELRQPVCAFALVYRCAAPGLNHPHPAGLTNHLHVNPTPDNTGMTGSQSLALVHDG